MEDPQLASIVALVANLNTDLDAVSEENYKLREQLATMRANFETLEHMVGGPPPRAPLYCGDTSLRKRARYGSVDAQTTIDP